MSLKLFSDEQILDKEFRIKAIAELANGTNMARKDEHRKRYEIYKDKTKRYVIETLFAEGLKQQTIAQMSNRAGNISVCKKIVNKLARAYTPGVQRTIGESAEAAASLTEFERALKFNDNMKKVDRYRELHRNCLVGVVPERLDPETDSDYETADTYGLKMRVLGPWQYDVLPDGCDPEKARCVLITDWQPASRLGPQFAASQSDAGYHKANLVVGPETSFTIGETDPDADQDRKSVV